MRAEEAAKLTERYRPMLKDIAAHKIVNIIRGAVAKGFGSINVILNSEDAQVKAFNVLEYIPTDQESIDYITDYFIKLGYGVEEVDHYNKRVSVGLMIRWADE